MQDLHLVGFTKDRRHLIFSTRKGAKSGSFLVPVDEDLIDAVDEVASYAADHGSGSESPDESPVEERPPSQPRVESSLSVKEVQTRLRAGEPVEAVATDAGVDPGWVERFAAPVRAEQRRIVERAMVSHLQRPRAGRSAVSLRQAITAAMTERKVHMSAEQFESAWHSHVEAPGRWVVGFTFPTRGKSRTLTWDLDVASGRLTTSDRFASQLGFRSADDLPAEDSAVEDASTTGGRRSGGLAIPGTTKASPVSEADLPRRPSPPVMPRRPMPPPTASATPPRRPSVPPSPPVTPRDTDGRPPRAGAEPPVRPEATGTRRPTPGRAPAAPPQPPERIQEYRDGGGAPEAQRPEGSFERRPGPVRPDPPVGPRPDTSRPARPSHPSPAEAVSAPAASMAPKAPAPHRQPRRDLDLPPPVRRPAPVATDAPRPVDEGDVEIAPSLRVISTEEDSSVRLIPAPPSDDVDEIDPEPGVATEPEPPVEDESPTETEEGFLDDDVQEEDVADEDDLAADDLEDALAEDNLEEADDDIDDVDDLDETDGLGDLDDADDEEDLVEHGADDAEDTDDVDDVDDEDELIERGDRDNGDDEDLELAEQSAAGVDSDSAEPSADDADDAEGDSDGDDVELEPVAGRRTAGRVRFATDADRGRSSSAGHDRDPVVTDDQQSGDEDTLRDEDTAEKAPVGDTIAGNENEPEPPRLRPIDNEDLDPRRRNTARRPRRSQPIVARSQAPPSDESSPARDAESESTVRRSSAQFKGGFAKVAGTDARDGVEPAAPEARRDSPPAPQRTGEAEKSGPKGDIEWPEGGEPGRGEARPQRRPPSEKPQSTGKKPRRRRSQPLRAR